MSQENVEIVKRALAAYSSTGDVPEDLFVASGSVYLWLGAQIALER